MAELNAVNILNAIRNSASAKYKELIPEATRTNISKIGDYIVAYDLMTDFLTGIYSKVAFENIVAKDFKNPLALFKKSSDLLLNYGTIEEVYINPSPDRLTPSDGSGLLTANNPKGYSVYHALNRQSTLKQTVNQLQAHKAFQNENAFMQWYNAVVIALSSGDNIAEFNLMKDTIGQGIQKGVLYNVEFTEDISKLSKTLSGYGRNFAFPSGDYNFYSVRAKKDYKGPSGQFNAPVVTWTKPEDIVLIVPATIQNEIDYEYLANAYNLSIVDMRSKTILVDAIDIGDDKTFLGLIADRNFLQAYDAVYKPSQFYNPERDEYTLYLHHWQYFFLSAFANCVCLYKTKNES